MTDKQLTQENIDQFLIYAEFYWDLMPPVGGSTSAEDVTDMLVQWVADPDNWADAVKYMKGCCQLLGCEPVPDIEGGVRQHWRNMLDDLVNNYVIPDQIDGDR